MTQFALRAEGIHKKFGATVALDGVDFAVAHGEIHAVVGENGAGKSTLIRILAGVHRPDAGRIFVAGKQCHFATPRDAIVVGIVTIPQELRLVPALSIAENITLGDLPVRQLGLVAVIDRARMRQEAQTVLAELDFHPPLDRPLSALSFAERQLVAIAKALHRECRIFILDEPTAALEKREIERLFAVLQRMRSRGTAVIYISHRLEEVVSLADRCTVLRDGRVAAHARRGAYAVHDLVTAMTGRSAEQVLLAVTDRGEKLLSAEPDGFTTVALHAGEIIGFAGLLGSGAGRMLRRLFGLERPVSAQVAGKRRRLKRPRDAIAAGIGMVPAERSLGLVMNQSVRDNIVLASLDAISRRGRLDRAAGDAIVREFMELLDIKPREPSLKVSALSGGNQQKVVLAKWLARRIAVLLLDEPTQGIDVAAKVQIHRLLGDFCVRGGGALVHSSDLSELARVCASVMAIRQGGIVAALHRGAGLGEHQLQAAIGG